jgi:hypothetical protein
LGCWPSKGPDRNPNYPKTVHGHDYDHEHVHDNENDNGIVGVDVDVLVLVDVDVDGFFKSAGMNHTPENVKLVLPPRQPGGSPNRLALMA